MLQWPSPSPDAIGRGQRSNEAAALKELCRRSLNCMQNGQWAAKARAIAAMKQASKRPGLELPPASEAESTTKKTSEQQMLDHGPSQPLPDTIVVEN